MCTWLQASCTPWHRTSYDDAEEGYQEAEAALEELEEAEEEEREVRTTSHPIAALAPIKPPLLRANERNLASHLL